jgi:glycosyltransferase involved in cell wall biosynthesis
MTTRRFAILSHILPPSPSGQSVMLYRIFSGFDPNEYYLISREEYKKEDGGKAFLPVEYFSIPSPRILYRLNKLKMPQNVRDLVNFIVLLMWRIYKLVRLVRRNPVQSIIACSGDVADIPAGYFASRLLGIKFYAYLFDDYVYQWTGFQRPIAKFAASFVFKNSAGVIGPNEYICEEYQRRYHTHYVIARNPCDTDELNLPPNDVWPTNMGKIKIMYTGAIYHANYDCFRRLIQSMETIVHHKVELHIYTAQTVDELRSQGIDGERVYIHSHVPYAQILEEQHKADILFLPLAFESPIPEVLRTSAPGKMGEYLASGRPVLAHVPPDSFVSYYMKKYQCAIVADEKDPACLADHIKNVIEDETLRYTIIKNARRQANMDFDPKTARESISNFLTSTLNRK